MRLQATAIARTLICSTCTRLVTAARRSCLIAEAAMR